MSTITSPHDKLFKTTMSDVRVAREFFENYLPQNIKKFINLDKLELSPKSYVDENLKALESDILYKTQLGDEQAYLYLLAEHQSKPDKLMPFRLLKYIIAIWTDSLKQTEEKKLPLIIPTVFYHGRDPYTHSKDIRDLIAAPRELVENTLFAPFHLVDTHEIPDEELRSQHWFGITAFFMKHILARDFLPYLKEAISALKQAEQEDGSNFVQTLLNYLLTTAEIPSLETFVDTVKEGLSAATGEKTMTLAEQLFLKGGHAVLSRLLKRKFNTVPSHYQKLVEQANEQQIYKWSENLMDAKTLDEVFASQ